MFDLTHDPVFMFTCLSTGLIICAASIPTILKVYKGSKSGFAYLLLILSLGFAI
jgi:hypothetical protein